MGSNLARLEHLTLGILHHALRLNWIGFWEVTLHPKASTPHAHKSNDTTPTNPTLAPIPLPSPSPATVIVSKYNHTAGQAYPRGT